MIRSLKFSLIAAASAGLLAACGSPTISNLSGSNGESTPTPNPTATPPSANASFAITMDAGSEAPSLELRDSKDVSFVVSAFNGFSGPVTVTVNGLAAGITSDVPSQIVNVAVNGTAAAKFTLKTDNAMIGAGSNAITLDGSAAGGLTGSASITATVLPVITLQTLATFPAAGTFNFWDKTLDGAALNDGTVIHMGTAATVTVKWAKMFMFDGNTATGHRIHGNGTTATGAPLVKDGSKTLDADGALEHSSGAAAVGVSSDDLTGAESGAAHVFVRTLNPTAATAKTVVDYYDHQNGDQGKTVTSISGRLTIYQP